jgi:hypothetical protein
VKIVFGVILLREQKAFYSVNHRRQINILCGKHARYFNVKATGTNKSLSDFED